MKKLLFTFLAFACMVLPFTACSDDDDDTAAAAEQQEVTVTVGEITDSTAVLSCVYNPVKSATYQLRIDEVVSEELSESVKVEVKNLSSGKRYDVGATAYDANHKEVSTSNVEFMTTGVPENPAVMMVAVLLIRLMII